MQNAEVHFIFKECADLCQGRQRCCENYHRLSLLCSQPGSLSTHSTVYGQLWSRGSALLVGFKLLSVCIIKWSIQIDSKALSCYWEHKCILLRTKLKSVSSAQGPSLGPMPLAWLRQKTGTVPTHTPRNSYSHSSSEQSSPLHALWCFPCNPPTRYQLLIC